MRVAFLLLRSRLRSALGAFRFATGRQRALGATLSLCSLLLFAALAVAFGFFLRGAEAVAGTVVVHSLLRELAGYLLLFLLAGGIPFVSGVLFAPGDLSLVGAMPVPPRAIALVRLVEGAVMASAQFLVLGTPLLCAGLWHLRPPLWGVLLAPLALLGALLVPSLASGLLLLLLARWLGVRRVRTAVALVSVLLAVGVCVVSVSAATRLSLGGDARALLTGKVVPAVGAPDPVWLPTRWAGDALLGLGGALPPATGVGSVLLLLALSAALGLGAMAVGEPLFMGEALSEGQGSAPSRTDSLGRLIGALPLPAPARAIVAKDLRYVLRDLTLLSQVGVPVILYLVPFLLAPQAARLGAGGPELLALSVFSVGFIAYMVCSILGLSSVGLEGRAFYLVKAAPVSARTLLLSKWLMATLASSLLTALLCAISFLAFSAPWWAWPCALVAVPVGCGALCGLEVGLSGLFPRFVFDNPAHRASIAALLWGFVGATLYVHLAALALALAAFALTSGGPFSLYLAGGGTLGFLALSGAAGWLPLRAAEQRLESYAWGD